MENYICSEINWEKFYGEDAPLPHKPIDKSSKNCCSDELNKKIKDEFKCSFDHFKIESFYYKEYSLFTIWFGLSCGWGKLYIYNLSLNKTTYKSPDDRKISKELLDEIIIKYKLNS